MSNNTDPKIQEIIERHASIMPEWHYNGNEIVLLSNPYRGIGGFLDEADNVFASNAPWDIAYLLSEIERLQTENKVMEVVLKWYADKDKYFVRPYGLESRDFYPAEIEDDKGQRARISLSHLKG